MTTRHFLGNAELTHVMSYISDVFRPCRDVGEWAGALSLPLYLQTNWLYRRLDLAGVECILMWDALGEQQETALKLRKHIEKLSDFSAAPIIYGVSNTTSFRRKRLIDQGIAFVVPGKQLYLPFAALDLRESFAPRKAPVRNALSTCAQQLVLLHCAGHWQSDLPAQTWAARLDVSKMSVSRAYKELSDLGMARLHTLGRQTNLVFETEGLALWERALPYLRSPVKREVRITSAAYEAYRRRLQSAQKEASHLGCAAGEWLLSSLGMLAAPKHPCFAMSSVAWEQHSKSIPLLELDEHEEDLVQIQVWRYEPEFIRACFGGFDTVDPFSLFLSLQNRGDDRIQLALHELVEKTWDEARNKS